MIEEGFTGFAIFCLMVVFLIKFLNVLFQGDFYEKPYIFLTFIAACVSYFFAFVGNMIIRKLSFSIYFQFSTGIFLLCVLFFLVEIILMFSGKGFRDRLNDVNKKMPLFKRR
jgi:hypothetical protein